MLMPTRRWNASPRWRTRKFPLSKKHTKKNKIMTRRTIPRVASKVTALAGCMALAVTTAALGQADTQNSRQHQPYNQTSNPGLNNNLGEQQVIEGRLVPLFDALCEGTSTSGMSQNTGQSSATRESATPRPADSAHPGLSTPKAATSMTPVAQPLALISEPGAVSQGKSMQSSTTAGRRSTPGANPASPSNPADRSNPSTATSGSDLANQQGTTTESGDVYVLVFDPADPQSRSAYLMAQTIAQSASHAPGAMTSPNAKATTPSSTTGAAASDPNRDRARVDMTPFTETHGDKVKITGRVIEREGLTAIAVQSVERQNISAPLSSSDNR